MLICCPRCSQVVGITGKTQGGRLGFRHLYHKRDHHNPFHDGRLIEVAPSTLIGVKCGGGHLFSDPPSWLERTVEAAFADDPSQYAKYTIPRRYERALPEAVWH